MSLRESIADFLAQKRIAVVGVSRNPRDFSRQLFKTMQDRGYDVIPVNPNASEIEDKPCYSQVKQIPGGVDGVLLMTPAEQNEHIVNDCLESGVDRIWFYRAAGTGAVSRKALELCRQNGISAIPGECPYMFLPRTGFPHNVHAWVRTTFSSKYN